MTRVPTTRVSLSMNLLVELMFLKKVRNLQDTRLALALQEISAELFSVVAQLAVVVLSKLLRRDT